MAISRGVNSFSARHGLQLALEALEKSASCLIPSSSATTSSPLPSPRTTNTETRRVRLRSPAHCCCLRHHGRCHLFSLCQALTSLQHQQRQPGDTLLFLVSTLSGRFSASTLSAIFYFGCFFAKSFSQHAPVNMRYEDWDILLFPRGCEVPMKEFKVACHVVHDPGEPTPQSLCVRRQSLDYQV